ncbi:unnamed protein product [Amoebophrya sp. A25]|nr:unnamed protein product [Amoebophrya sp. A25]|eukprot:GSA25T00010404001.1
MPESRSSSLASPSRREGKQQHGDDDSEFGDAVLVLDNGTGHIKAGLACADAPTVVMPNVVARLKSHVRASGADRSGAKPEIFVGSDAIAKRGLSDFRYPIHHGIVTDWEDMERVWRHLFLSELRLGANLQDHPVLLTEAPLNPRKNRERMLEILFDSFGAPAVCVVIQAVMSLYSMGRTTGVVVDAGDGVTHVVPIYEGFAFPHAVQRLDLAGRDLTENMRLLMQRRGFNFETSSERDLLGKMKEQLCYVALDVDAETQKVQKNSEMELDYELPDGRLVTIAEERFLTPEPLFKPMLIGKEAPGVAEQVSRCIKIVDIDLRRDMYYNVVLSGGTTLFPGLPERLQFELTRLAPPKCQPRVLLPETRRYVVWKGAAVLAQMPNFGKMCVWRNEYDDIGSHVVHSRCL